MSFEHAIIPVIHSGTFAQSSSRHAKYNWMLDRLSETRILQCHSPWRYRKQPQSTAVCTELSFLCCLRGAILFEGYPYSTQVRLVADQATYGVQSCDVEIQGLVSPSANLLVGPCGQSGTNYVDKVLLVVPRTKSTTASLGFSVTAIITSSSLPLDIISITSIWLQAASLPRCLQNCLTFLNAPIYGAE